MSTEKLENALNSLSDAITIHDREGNILFANSAAEGFLNATGPIGGKCYEVFHGLDAPPDYCPSCRCWETKTEISLERYEPHIEKRIHIRTVPQFDAEGLMVATIHIIKEVKPDKYTHSSISENILSVRESPQGKLVSDNAPI